MNIVALLEWWDKNRKLLFCVAVSLFIFYFLLSPVNYYLAKSLYEGAFFRMGIPVLLGIYLAARGLRDGKEVRILLLYWCWIAISRMLNGDPTLTSSLTRILELLLMVLLFAPGVILPYKQREILFDVTAVTISVCHFIICCIAVYVAISGKRFISPIDDRMIGYLHDIEDRLYVLDNHPNTVAGQHLISFCLLCALFFRHKNTAFRIWTVIAAGLNVVIIAMSLSRNGQTFLAVTVAMMAGILLVRHLHGKKIFVRCAAFLAALLLITPLFYQIYEPIRYGLWTVSASGTSEAGQIKAKPVAAIQTLSYNAETDTYEEDSRDYLASGRKEIYKSALESIRQEPKRLLIGSSYDHYLDISHAMIKEQAHNFHNLILEVVNLFGLPGLSLVVWFYICLVKRGWYLIFDPENRFSLAEQTLVLPIVALTGFYMLEAGLFTDMEFRAAFFFFTCGIMTGVTEIGKNQNG